MRTFTTTTNYIHLADQVVISCVTATNESKPEGYPVLTIGPLSIIPSPQQLYSIRDAIGYWLLLREEEEATHDVPSNLP